MCKWKWWKGTQERCLWKSRAGVVKQISGRCNALFIRPARKLYLHIPCIFHRGGFNKISVSISSFLVSSFTTVSRHHQRHYSLEEFQAKTARTWLDNAVVLNIAVLRYFTLIHIALLINYRHKVFYFFFLNISSSLRIFSRL